MADKRDLEVVPEGRFRGWSWRWHTPTGTTVVSPQAYSRRREALAAGRAYVNRHT